jgi:hypothetical protein
MAEFLELELPGLIDQSWNTIQKFSEIDIQPNTLILCDIDDTLFYHPILNPIWNSLIQTFFYMRQYSDTGKYDRVVSDLKATEYFNEIYRTIPIRHTDREGFFAMVGKASEFAFVTARPPTTKDFAYENLRSIDVNPDLYNVHFCGNIAKGEYIVQHFDLAKYDHVVFIDDQERNLENVSILVDHKGLKLYKFKYTMLPEQYPLPPGFNPELGFDGENVVHLH